MITFIALSFFILGARVAVASQLPHFLNFNQLMLILWLGWSVCKYVCMYVSKYVCNMYVFKYVTLSSFHQYLLNNSLKLHKTLHEYYYRECRHFCFSRLWPQRSNKSSIIKICYETSFFICISGSIFLNLSKLCNNVNIGYAVILPIHDFHLRGQTNVAYV